MAKISYNFNKSINQYFIGGCYIVPAAFNNCRYLFACVYNNGTAGGVYDDSNGTGYIGCTANGFSISGNTGSVYAVIIYPAIYGDVTIS